MLSKLHYDHNEHLKQNCFLWRILFKLTSLILQKMIPSSHFLHLSPENHVFLYHCPNHKSILDCSIFFFDTNMTRIEMEKFQKVIKSNKTFSKLSQDIQRLCETARKCVKQFVMLSLWKKYTLYYSEVLNRRADRNKWAGLEKNSTLPAFYYVSK